MSIIDNEADATVVGRYAEPKPQPGVLTEITLDPGHNELFDLAIVRGWSTMARTIQQEDDGAVHARWRAVLGIGISCAALGAAITGAIVSDVVVALWVTIGLAATAVLVSSVQDILLTTYRGR